MDKFIYCLNQFSVPIQRQLCPHIKRFKFGLVIAQKLAFDRIEELIMALDITPMFEVPCQRNKFCFIQAGKVFRGVLSIKIP